MAERTVSGSVSSPPADPVPGGLVGRQDQLSAAAAALMDPGCRGALVVAPAGMGKTALLHAVMAAEPARFRFFPLAAGAAAGMGVPFAALTPMLSHLPAGGPPAAADVLRTVEAFIGAGVPARRRPVVVVDDADELDGASASVLARLADTGAVRLLAGTRPGAGSHSGAAALIGNGLFREIGLAPLSGPERDEFCRTALGAPAVASSLKVLGEASGGSPRLLGLLLQEARDTGCLVRRNGTWLLAGELPPDSPALLDATRQELSRLGHAERSAAAVLALLGPARRSTVEEFIGPETLDGLIAAGYAVSGQAFGGPQVRLTAALHEESVRRLAPFGLRRQLHRWLGSRPDGVGPGTHQLAAVRRALDSGEPVADGQLLAAAAEANSRFLPGAALQLAGALAGTCAAAAVQAARAQLYRGQLRTARSLAWQALCTAGNPEQAAEAAGIAGQLVLQQGQGQAGYSELAAGWTAALARLEPQHAGAAAGPGPQLLRLQALQAGGHLREALGAAEVLARTCPDPAIRNQALVVLAEVQAAAGLAVRSTATAGQVLEAIDGGAGCGPLPAVQLRLRLVRQLIRNGELEPAGRQLAALEASGAGAMLVFGGTLDFLRAWLALKRGFSAEARTLLAVAVEGLRVSDPELLLPYALGRAAAAAAQAQDGQEAGRYAREFGSLEHHGPAEASLLAQAYIDAAGTLAGSVEEALERLADTARTLGSGGLLAAELEVRMLMLQLGDRSRLDELISCAGAAEGAEAALCLGQARAVRSRCGKQGMAIAEQAAEAGHLMIAADAAAWSVRQLGSAPQKPLARQARRFLQDLGSRCPGIVGLPASGASPGRRLTERERDVAVMAAGGIRTREIAGRLGVSARTVEGHLYRIYEKLGIRSRGELAASLGRDTEPEPALGSPPAAGR